MTRRQYFTAGFKDGIPICLGYIAVSFTFGIMAKKIGISIFDAVLISLTNVTSAGQFAGLTVLLATEPMRYIIMAVIFTAGPMFFLRWDLIPLPARS